MTGHRQELDGIYCLGGIRQSFQIHDKGEQMNYTKMVIWVPSDATSIVPVQT